LEDKRATVRFLWYAASFQLPCRRAALVKPTPSSTDRASSHSDANIYGQDAVFAETGHDTGGEIRTNAEVASIGDAISPAIATWLGHASPPVIEVL
jgi:hypothetical protein